MKEGCKNNQWYDVTSFEDAERGERVEVCTFIGCGEKGCDHMRTLPWYPLYDPNGFEAKRLSGIKVNIKKLDKPVSKDID